MKHSSKMDTGWEAIFTKYHIAQHDFEVSPFPLDAKQIKEATRHLSATSETEVRLLCKMDTREERPLLFQERGLFLLPTTNGSYSLIQGEGYVDIPPILSRPHIYESQLDFPLRAARVGDSEMQHLDYAFASSLIRSFFNDDSLVLIIRGRKYTPPFSFRVGKHTIDTNSVQTEVDAGYEGRDQVVLMEAKNAKVNNVIIRQLFYPLRQWQIHTQKQVRLLFFAKQQDEYLFWHFHFRDQNDYNSIELLDSQRFTIVEPAENG